MEQVLELRHIYYSYHTPEGETPALADISFSLSKGEFIAIVGPSGCGKSDLRSSVSGKRADPYQWQIHAGKYDKYRIYVTA